jgi:ATP-dependent RNA helicase RhlE
MVDLIEQGHLTLNAVEIFVLDEADQMMDLGFIHALKRVVKLLPHRRQSLFFSATMPKAIRELADQFIKDPVEVKVAPESTTAERVTQEVIFVNQAEKQALLTMALMQLKIDRALVFTRTKHGADRVVKLLEANGVASNAIHGNKSQPQRERALGLFRSGEVPILVATDIAARGIDVSGVSHVFNFELPNVPEQYVHRIGRTARAGADGIAISFCADDEKPYLRDIEKLTRQKITLKSLPDDFQAEAAKLLKSRKPVVMTRDEQNGRNGRAQQGGARGGRAGGAEAAAAGERRFFPAKKKFSARPAGSGGGRPGGGQRSAGGARGGR